jgi:hypothetical protein
MLKIKNTVHKNFISYSWSLKIKIVKRDKVKNFKTRKIQKQTCLPYKYSSFSVLQQWPTAEWLILVLNCWQGHQTRYTICSVSQHTLYRQDDCTEMNISTSSCNSASATHDNNMQAGFKLGFVLALILTYCLCCTWAASNNVTSTLTLYS